MQKWRKYGQSDDAICLQAFVSGTAEGGSKKWCSLIRHLNCFAEILILTLDDACVVLVVPEEYG